MPHHIYYQPQNAYFYDLTWAILIPINILRSNFFLFFSRPPQTIISPIFLKLVLLIVMATVFLKLSLNMFIHRSDGTFTSIFRLKFKHEISYFFWVTLFVSILSPSTVFYYYYFFILLLSIWPSLKKHQLFGHVLYYITNESESGSESESEPEWNLLDHTLQILYYYDLRWILSMIVNFFSRYIITTSPQNVLKDFLIISIISVSYLFISFMICLTRDENGLFFIVIRHDYRNAWSPLITILFIFSIFSPMQMFWYIVPLIPLLGLWPYVSHHILSCTAPVIHTSLELDDTDGFI